MNPPFPQSIHPCLCANTLTNAADYSSEYSYAWNDVEYTVDSHLNLGTRRSRHQLRNLPQINAASQVHLPGVDLKNVQTSLFVQNENMLRIFFFLNQLKWGYIRWRRCTSSFGGGNSIFLSILPGLSKAESSMSMRFVAIMTWERLTSVSAEMN